MNEIYENILPYLEQIQVGFDRTKLVISLDNLVRALAKIKNVSYEEELSELSKLIDNENNIKDVKLNEFDEYEEIKD
jgi:hypothetical protein